MLIVGRLTQAFLFEYPNAERVVPLFFLSVRLFDVAKAIILIFAPKDVRRQSDHKTAHRRDSLTEIAVNYT